MHAAFLAVLVAFLVPVNKYLLRGNLREKTVYCGSRFKGHHVREGMVVEAATG